MVGQNIAKMSSRKDSANYDLLSVTFDLQGHSYRMSHQQSRPTRPLPTHVPQTQYLPHWHISDDSHISHNSDMIHVPRLTHVTILSLSEPVHSSSHGSNVSRYLMLSRILMDKASSTWFDRCSTIKHLYLRIYRCPAHYRTATIWNVFFPRKPVTRKSNAMGAEFCFCHAPAQAPEVNELLWGVKLNIATF